MATRVANPPANSPYKGPVIQVDSDAGYAVDVNDQTVAVVAAGAGSTVTLPQNPQADVTTILFVAEAAFNLTAGVLGGLAPDPMPILAGDNFYMTRTKAGTWVKDNDAGGGSGITPLVRTKFIDGDTTTPAADANGSIGLPYAKASAFMGVAPGIGVIQSVSDATQGMIGLVSPATVAAYTENVAVQPYRNVELRGMGFGSDAYPVITGNITWTNTAAQVTANGGNPANAPASANFTMHNLQFTGNLTVTDDAVTSTVLVSADEMIGTNIGGNAVLTGATHVSIFETLNGTIGGSITSTANAAGASILLVGGAVLGASITGGLIQAINCGLSCTAFTTNAGSTSLFQGCTFGGASPVMTLGAGSIAQFDSYSWASFLAAGGTIASGTVKLLSGNPPSRVRYVDGGSLVTSTPTGDLQAPYTSLSNAITGIGASASAGDANQTSLIKLLPSTIAAYTENPAFRAYRNYKVWADGASGQIGMTITGTATWVNTAASGGTAGSASSLGLHDVFITSTLTVTDDATSSATIIISGSESKSFGPVAGLGGDLVATGATDLASIVGINATFAGNITSTANASGANVTIDNCSVNNVTAKSISARRSVFNASTITVNSGSTMRFIGCEFQGAATLVAGAAGTITMDGASWSSFLEGGGAITSGIVLIIGGSQNGLVQVPPTAAAGGSTSIGDASISVSLNGQAAGTTAGFTGGGNFYEEKTTLTGARTVTVKTGGGELKGDTIDIVRSGPSGALGAFTLTVNNNAGNPQGVIAASQRGWVRVQFNTVVANDWGVIAVGGGVT